jgi:hypothetical protein
MSMQVQRAGKGPENPRAFVGRAGVALSGCLGGLCLLLAVFFWYERSYLGFPDGHLTELEATYRWFFILLAGLSLVFSLSFLSFLVWRWPRTVLSALVVGGALVAGAAYGFDVHLRAHLDDGAGG